MDRRIVLGLMGGALLPASADEMRPDGFLPGDSTNFVPLWPGKPPGGEGINLTLKVTDAAQSDGFHVRAISQIQEPGFFVYPATKPDGRGLLITPGGGYASEGGDRGGREIAQHFAAQGITCFVLRYRLPGEGWKNRELVPLQDAQRAMRILYAWADHFGCDTKRLAAIGFSAGGHLSASLALRYSMKTYESVDSMDMIIPRPLVAAHMYPVVTMGEGAHPGSLEKLLGPNPSPASVTDWSLEKHVAADSVPSFICLATDDTVVPPFPNGIAMFGALQAAKVPSELHVFEVGGHGFSLHWAQGKPCAAWPGLFTAWAATHGFKA